MDTPDHERDNVAANGNTNESLTVSMSSEDSDSWTLLGKNADQLDNEPSGVEIVKANNEVKGLQKEERSKRKQRHDSQRSIDSQLDESSDGISIISESDVAGCDKLLLGEDPIDDQGEGTIHFRQKVNLKLLDYEPLTPPYTPDEAKVREEKDAIEHPLQVQKVENKSMDTTQSVAEYHHPLTVHYSSWIIFSIIATAMAAVILGNAMRLQNRVDQINYEHEKRISDLELENNILKNEMNKLRHAYTRSELDEQVQRAEFEWVEVLRQQESGAPAATDNVYEAFGDANLSPELPEQEPVRKVPPQDSGVKRKVVWSGDEEEPMLIADKDYVLPAFCYQQDQAVQDDLFFEYSAKYCDVRKRKVEAKQKKAEFLSKLKPNENYNKFIHQRPSETAQESASFDPSKLASPFNIDYKKAFDAIKSEGSIIVEALGSILNLSPEPDAIFKSKVTNSIPKEEEQLSTDEAEIQPKKQDFSNPNNDRNPTQNYKTHERSGSDNDQKQAEEFNYMNKKQVQGELKGNNAQVQFDDSRKRHNRKDHTDSDKGKKNSPRDPQIQVKGYDDYNDDEDDDHYKEIFGAQDKAKPQEQGKRRHDQRQHGSGERQQWNHSREGSYLEQHKRETKDQGSVRDGKRHRDHKTYHKHEKHGEWHEKQYKGREDYRQEGGEKHGEWNDKRYKEREEYRQKDEQNQGEWHEKRYKGREVYRQKGEWHDKRYKGREQFRQKGEQKHGEWHDKRYKGREEYRQKGGRQGERKGSEERK